MNAFFTITWTFSDYLTYKLIKKIEQVLQMAPGFVLVFYKALLINRYLFGFTGFGGVLYINKKPM
jgi:hypothetical protein